MQIDGDTLIPELLRQLPASRTVLDKYGLKGCGGTEGPHEPLRVFARAHDVPLKQLLDEVRTAKPATSTVESAEKPALADVIYRRFFIAAIAFLLTAGATWGAHILAKIALHKSFAAASIFDIQAHAQAQVFGWMGLTIMGFAYQAFPRFWHTSLASASRANASFWLMVSGIVLAATGLATMSLPIAVIGGTLEMCAVVLFAAELLVTFKQSKKKIEPYIAFVFAAVVWFLIGSALNVLHIWALVMGNSVNGYNALANQISSAMRDVQFHGLGLTIILGVSLRTLPHIFGAPQARAGFAYSALAAITSAVLLEVFSPAAGPLAAGIMLAVSLMAIAEFRMWRPFPDGDRSEKFIKAAWCWLVVSLFMLLAYPTWISAVHLQASHALIGASRHAITVGFISLMIMGYAAKVTATLNGLDVKKLTNLMMPFVLVNAGCTIRVIGQSLTDVASVAFPVMGISGVLETTGMAIWGWHLFSVIRQGRRATAAAAKSCSTRPQFINADHIVADVVEWYPQTVPIFEEFGFRAITNEFLRRTVAKQVTLRRACQMHDIPIEDFVTVLNDTINATRCTGCTGDGTCGN